jgi:hypothetical protein
LRGDFYVDPSGVVQTRLGVPIAGATVTLTRSSTRAGHRAVVPAGSAIMSPSNRRNPDRTDVFGGFGWDVVPGYYQVTARKHGCRGTARTPVLAIPPPFTDLRLRLPCNGPPRSLTRLRLLLIRGGAHTTVVRAAVQSVHSPHARRPHQQPTGTVTFRIGHVTLASSVLDPATRTALLDVPPLVVRGHFSATYSGNAVFAPSQATGT